MSVRERAEQLITLAATWTDVQKSVAAAERDHRLTTYVAAIRSASNYNAEHHEPQLRQQAQEAQYDWELAESVTDAVWPLISEAPWVARQLLEALNRIEAAGKLHYPDSQRIQALCGCCQRRWPCPTWLALDPKEADE